MAQNTGIDELDDEIEDDDPSKLVRDLRAQLKDATRKNRTLQEEADAGKAATRKVALLEAKLPDTPQVKFFLEKYDGDLTADAIRTAAAEHGFYTPDAESAADVAGHEAISQASQGAESTINPGTEDAMLAEMDEAARLGGSKAVEAVMRKHGRFIGDE